MKQVYDKQNIITIYEIDEAEDLIKRLAARWSDDIQRVSRGKRGGAAYYRFPCSFDIETTTIRSGQLDYYHPEGRPVAFPYLFQFCIYGKVIMVRHIEEAMQIFDWIARYFELGPKKHLVIFDHNLAYEYGFFKDLWELECKKCFALDVHHPVTLMLTNGIEIRDSYKMSNMSLESLTKDWSRKYYKKPEIMDYSRLRTSFDDLDDDTLLYSALDVLSLSDAMRQFLAAHNTGVWTRSPTSTGFIRIDTKKTVGISVHYRTPEQKRYIRKLQHCKIDEDIYRMLKRQARGGNTHANRVYTGTLIDETYHGDIASSYPTQMVCRPEYPIGVWRPLDPDTPLKAIIELEAGGFCTLFDLVLVDPQIKDGVTVPYLANSKTRTLQGVSRYSDNGRYLRGAHMLETTIYGIELPIILSQYNFMNSVVLGGYYARKGYLPDILRRYILKLYADKTQLKGLEDKAVEYALAKTYVNGVYGMAFTDIIRSKCDFDERGIFETEPPEIGPELERFQKSASYFLPYAWGSMTSTLGRVHLQAMIDAVGEDFVYCDTDSIFARNPEKSRAAIKALDEKLSAERRKCGLELVYLDRKGKPHELGMIDEEPPCSFKSWGAKKYITVDRDGLHCTVAGVPKKAGGRIIGTPDRFELGLVFPGSQTNKLCLWYNDDEDLTLHDEQGRPIRVYSNVAMLPVNYILGLSDDYSLCLQVEGINQRYVYEQANNNMLEDFV